MPRMSRDRSKSGIYHIIMRGINRQSIFQDNEDYIKFLHTLQKYKQTCEYELYAYCLMGNHIHLLLREGKEPLESVMRRICGSYVLWYNRKYDRVGYLFQDRYKSEPVEDDTYFLTVLRYIFLNPVKAGIVFSVEKYTWSNYNEYIHKNIMTNVDFTLKMFNSNRDKAIHSFVEYIKKPNDDNCIDISEKRQISDDDARVLIKDTCKVLNGTDMQKLDILTRNAYLKVLKEVHNLSIRQIERLTGISRGVVQKA